MGTCAICGSQHDAEAALCPRCGERLNDGISYDDCTYAAFVSYRHLPRDASVAARLQRFIEGFTVPKGLRAAGSGRKVGKLFRDEDELPTSSSLSDQIRDALKKSRFLIVVCTPETRESLWVQREVELFASFHGRERILVALASGEPGESFPELLLNRSTREPDGTLGFEPAEPLAADFRPEASHKFKNEALRIIAPLLGCGYDDLKQRQRARRNAMAAKIGGAVAAASLAFAGVTLSQQVQILEKQHDLQVSQSRYLASEVDGLLQQGDRMQAVQVALAALPESTSSHDRPLVPEAQSALEEAVRAYPTQDGWKSSFSRVEEAAVDAYAVNEESGEYAVIDTGQQVKVYDIASGAEVSSFNLADAVDAELLSDSSSFQLWFPTPHRLIVDCFQSDSIICIDSSSASLVWASDPVLEGWYADGMCVSADGSLMCLSGIVSEFDNEDEYVYRGKAVIFDAKTGKVVREHTQEVEQSSAGTSCAFSEGGDKVCFSMGTMLSIVGLSDGSITNGTLAYGDETKVSWLDAGIFATSANTEEIGSLPCAVQKFDANGKEAWRVEERVPINRFGGLMYESEAKIWECLSERGQHGEEVLASFGGHLVAIDSESGEASSITELVAPVIACSVTGDAPYQRIHVCSAGGGVRYIAVTEDEVMVGTDIDTEIGNTSRARFAHVGETTYLITMPRYSESTNAKTAVFELYSTAPLREPAVDDADWVRPKELSDKKLASTSRSLKAVLETQGLVADDVQFAMISPDGRKAIFQAHGRVMRADVASSKVDAASIASFDGLVAGGFADGGRLFYAQCPIAGDYSGRCTLLVFDMESELFDPQSEIRFGIMLSDDAKEVLIDDKSITRTSTWTMPYLSVDDLIARGSDLSSDFELTDAQSASLYITDARQRA